MGGWVLGMASTIVNPPASAADVPVSQSSLWVAPGSRKWTWRSIKPGSLSICQCRQKREPVAALLMNGEENVNFTVAGRGSRKKRVDIPHDSMPARESVKSKLFRPDNHHWNYPECGCYNPAHHFARRHEWL